MNEMQRKKMQAFRQAFEAGRPMVRLTRVSAVWQDPMVVVLVAQEQAETGWARAEAKAFLKAMKAA